KRRMTRWVHEAIMEEMEQRVAGQPEKVKARKSLVEHPFGTMKRGMDQGYFLTRGLAKVRGEMRLTVLVYNLKSALPILADTRSVAAPQQKRGLFGAVLLAVHATRRHVEGLAHPQGVRLPLPRPRELASQPKATSIEGMGGWLCDNIGLHPRGFDLQRARTLPVGGQLCGIHSSVLREMSCLPRPLLVRLVPVHRPSHSDHSDEAERCRLAWRCLLPPSSGLLRSPGRRSGPRRDTSPRRAG